MGFRCGEKASFGQLKLKHKLPHTFFSFLQEKFQTRTGCKFVLEISTAEQLLYKTCRNKFKVGHCYETLTSLVNDTILQTWAQDLGVEKHDRDRDLAKGLQLKISQ